MKFLPGPETRAAVAKHPVVLAGVAVVALLGLTAGVLVVVDSARGEGGAQQQVIVEPKTQTPGPRSKTATALGVSGRTVSVTAVRFAPGARTQVLGTLPAGRDVQIDGRTEDDGWFRIIFPPNSELHGWVDAEALEITGDPTTLLIATAEPPIQVELPTEPASRFTPQAEETPGETQTPEGTATPEGGGLPDLVVGTTPVITAGQLFITVVNQGTGAFTGDLVVAIFNPDGTALLGGATLPGFTLEPGLSIDVGTGFMVTSDMTLLLVVDPNGEIEEADNTNNQVVISVATGNPPPPGEEPPIDPQSMRTPTLPPLPFTTPIP
jgi:hypothetical protein